MREYGDQVESPAEIATADLKRRLIDGHAPCLSSLAAEVARHGETSAKYAEHVQRAGDLHSAIGKVLDAAGVPAATRDPERWQPYNERVFPQPLPLNERVALLVKERDGLKLQLATVQETSCEELKTLRAQLVEANDHRLRAEDGERVARTKLRQLQRRGRKA